MIVLKLHSQSNIRKDQAMGRFFCFAGTDDWRQRNPILNPVNDPTHVHDAYGTRVISYVERINILYHIQRTFLYTVNKWANMYKSRIAEPE